MGFVELAVEKISFLAKCNMINSYSTQITRNYKELQGNGGKRGKEIEGGGAGKGRSFLEKAQVAVKPGAISVYHRNSMSISMNFDDWLRTAQ